MEAYGHIPVWGEQRVLRRNARGRQIYCEQFKAWLVEHALKPGMSVAGLAMRNQVNANLLRRWMQLHQHRVAGMPASQLLAVTVSEVSAPEVRAPSVILNTPEAPVEIELNGARVRVHEDASQHLLQRVIAALRGMSA